MSKQDKELVVKPQENMPAFLQNKETNRGSEQVGTEDLVVPRLELVQSLSKCRKKSDPAYIEGIEEGMLYNNVTREILGHDVIVCPVFFAKEWLLWRDQDLGGGFGGAFPTKQEADDALKDQENPEEWEVVDTHQHYCLLIKPNGTEEIAVSMAKSKAKVSRNWNSMIRLNGGDRFSRLYKITGVGDQNAKGQDFFNMRVSNFGYVNEEIYRRAEALYESVVGGSVTIDRSTDDDFSGSDDGSEF